MDKEIKNLKDLPFKLVEQEHGRGLFFKSHDGGYWKASHSEALLYLILRTVSIRKP